MNLLAFSKTFSAYPVFSVKDITKVYPNFDSRRLVEWQQQGHILKLKRGYYRFEGSQNSEYFLCYAANKMYRPSYVSLESALAFYCLIPEGVFITTSVTTLNTAKYQTSTGSFSYKHLKPSLFFGYKLLQGKEVTASIAEPEKAILDYLYLNKLNTMADMNGMRFNAIQVKEVIDFEKLALYQTIFHSKTLDKRVSLFKKVIDA